MKSTILFLLFFLPLISSAQVVITEIMYDLGPESASDMDREWVEIFNSGQNAIDLADWRFVESGSNHTFLPYPASGDVILYPNTYAVIVIKPSAFLADWPGFSGKILDSLFSLKNSEGEMLSLRDQSGVGVGHIIYDPVSGASGDGNSLQRTPSGWVAALPTPGSAPMDSGDLGSGVRSSIGGGFETRPEPEETQSSSEQTPNGTLPLLPPVSYGDVEQTPAPSPQENLGSREETTSHTVSAGSALPSKEEGPFFLSPWFLALSALITVAVSGFFLARRGPVSEMSPEEKLAYEIEIIEEKGAEETKER